MNQPRLPLDGHIQPELPFEAPEYHPSPQIVPDDHEGYDSEGNYHALDTASPYRWAAYLNSLVIEQVQMWDYTVSVTDREDMATDIIDNLVNQNAFDPPSLAFDALVVWRSIYGRDLRE